MVFVHSICQLKQTHCTYLLHSINRCKMYLSSLTSTYKQFQTGLDKSRPIWTSLVHGFCSFNLPIETDTLRIPNLQSLNKVMYKVRFKIVYSTFYGCFSIQEIRKIDTNNMDPLSKIKIMRKKS